MKNIIRIARNDIHNIRKNVIALIVIFGITIVPSLYAWFNIAASWDPYKNTGNLKVAVASLDKGYDGELLPVRLNLGNDIISSLRENTQDTNCHRRIYISCGLFNCYKKRKPKP